MSALVKSSIREIIGHDPLANLGRCVICGQFSGRRFIDDSTGQHIGLCCVDEMVFGDRILHQTVGLRRPVQGEQFPENS